MTKQMYLLFLIVSFFSSFSLAKGKTDALKNDQLCYLKEAYLRNSVYEYKKPYFHIKKGQSKQIMSLLIIRDGHRGIPFTKSSWQLRGIEVKLSPFSSHKSVTQWFEFNDKKNKLNKLCLNKTKKCQFKVVYEGDLYPSLEKITPNRLSFTYNNNMRVSIYDRYNNILKFPINCEN